MTDKKEETKTEASTGKPWFKSLTVQGLIAAVVVLCVLPRLGIEIPTEYSTEVFAAVTSWIVIGLRNAAGDGLSIK